MTLNQLIEKANKHYPDGFLAHYWDGLNQKVIAKNCGDTLAQFIVRELQDTFDENANDAEQIVEVRRALKNAHREIGNIIDKLGKA
jgi:hypothetical protein